MDENYVLKHKNNAVAVFRVDDADSIINIRLSKNNKYELPLNCINTTETVKWLKNRGIPVTRHKISREMAGMSLFRYMLGNHGISLTDHYWIQKVGQLVTWEDVNAYNNNFRSKMTLEPDKKDMSIVGETNFNPSASLQGDLKKKWIIDSVGNRILVKGNYAEGCLQSISEVFASLMHSKQGFRNHVEYKFIDISSDGEIIHGCCCKNFTDIHTEFVPAIDIVSSVIKQNNVSSYEHYIKLCSANGISQEEIRGFMDYQIMTDFIVTNTDRHFNNFGVIRSSETRQFIRPAPIFDTGNSLFYKSGYVPIDKGLLDIEVTSFRTKEVQMLKYVRNRNLVDISKLPTIEELGSLLSKDTTLKGSKVERILQAYSKKIDYFYEFQRGKSIWAR